MTECGREFGSFVSSSGDWAEIKPGSLRYVTRRTNNRAQEKSRVTPVGMTEFFVWCSFPALTRFVASRVRPEGLTYSLVGRSSGAEESERRPRKRRRGRYTGKFEKKADGAGEGFGFD
jgi:hypothetical protein